jgi:SGNH hydrolase-like domain, acetyltransferase AlgX
MAIHTQSPYGEERNPNEEIRLSAGMAWAVIVVFLLLITVPPIAREVSGDGIVAAASRVVTGRDGRLIDRLRQFEKRVDEAGWIRPLQHGAQGALTAAFNEGNRKVFIGKEGKLFLRPGLRALTGYGPLHPEPLSVAKDPTHGRWQPPLQVIEEFAAQLHERGIALVLAPVPDKAAIWVPAGRQSQPTPPRHPSGHDFYAALKRAGVRVVDLGDWLEFMPPDVVERGFLRQDTHWNPVAMMAVARRIAETIPDLRVAREAVASPPPALEQVAIGDLVKRLGLPESSTRFGRERVALHPSPMKEFSDVASPVVLLGDSFVNVFEDPSLGWSAHGCGLGAHLAYYLGRPLHIIALNGGGSSECREQFARLPDDIVRAKATVIWVLAERDLFLSASAARDNGVEWRRVAFNPNKSTESPAPAAAIVLEATLKAKSALQDVVTSNYPDAVYTAGFNVDRVVAGAYPHPEAVVVLWNFRNRQTQPSAHFQPGQKFRLKVVLWTSRPDLNKINLSDDFSRFDLPLLYGEEASPLP